MRRALLNSLRELIDWFPVKKFTVKVLPVIVAFAPNSCVCWGEVQLWLSQSFDFVLAKQRSYCLYFCPNWMAKKCCSHSHFKFGTFPPGVLWQDSWIIR